MLTKKERELVDYWYNWKSGAKPFVSKVEDEPPKLEVKVEVPGFDGLAEEMVDRLWDIL